MRKKKAKPRKRYKFPTSGFFVRLTALAPIFLPKTAPTFLKFGEVNGKWAVSLDRAKF
ncbi:hypothetical protein GR158_13825 [Shinella sp. AETb1-6]|uniref:hypothetical protein n=1 Tax=Shinella TaxID=323620 RepID=UPI00136BF352|nr:MULTISPECIES: hypothetical protein [Shinella]MCD1264688.1 hypothetical protein [Shinella sumterensis]MXN52197.1 hypothetical protein [Shinella sp. AETb1-6]WLS08576.1 hypothetical protein Q9314_01985 [Shinella sumterensis]